MKKKRPSVKVPVKIRARRVPKAAIVLAQPPADTPVVSIDRLKGGEITWSIRAPGPSLPAAIERAVLQAKRLHAKLDEWREELAAIDQARREAASARVEAEVARKESEKAARVMAAAADQAAKGGGA